MNVFNGQIYCLHIKYYFKCSNGLQKCFNASVVFVCLFWNFRWKLRNELSHKNSEIAPNLRYFMRIIFFPSFGHINQCMFGSRKWRLFRSETCSHRIFHRYSMTEWVTCWLAGWIDCSTLSNIHMRSDGFLFAIVRVNVHMLRIDYCIREDQ